MALPQKTKPQISRNFGLRSVGVCFAYPSFDKPFSKVYADERRFIVPGLYMSRRRRQMQAKVDALRRLQEETSAELDALMPAVLDRAFKEEL